MIALRSGRAGIPPNSVDLQTDVRVMAERMANFEDRTNERLDRLENAAETTGQHRTSKLELELERAQQENEALEKREQARKDRENEARIAREDEAKKAEAAKQAAIEKDRRDRRGRYFEIAFTVLFGAVVGWGITKLSDCKPANTPSSVVVVPAPVAPVTSAATDAGTR